MSLALVSSEIAKFISSGTPEVLCLRGKWGVGKTHTWNAALNAAVHAKSTKLLRYSYVSLFGVNSLDEMKFSIFENTIPVSDGSKPASLETLDANISQHAQWRKYTSILSRLPIVNNFIGANLPAMISFMTVNEQIVCIDDVERRGDQLSLKDVLGLISLLKEQRRCKVTLILNDEKLAHSDRSDFDKHLEKVVDTTLAFVPNSHSATSIAITDVDTVASAVIQNCRQLEITNIRIIRRAHRLSKDVEPLLAPYDPEVLNLVIKSVVLFCWCRDDPDESPSFDFLKSKNNYRTTSSFHEGDASDKSAAWNSLLEAYGYKWTDDFDLALMDGVANGYFDPKQIDRFARDLNNQILLQRSGDAFSDAWRLYHDSFDNNENAMVEALDRGFRIGAKTITPNNLNGTVTLLKELGHNDRALALIDYYIATREDDAKFWDLEDSPFGDRVVDPDIRTAFAKKALETRVSKDISEILATIDDSWSQEDLETLSRASVEDYRRAFKDHEGQRLRKIISGAFTFARISNPTPEMREVTRRAQEALKLIGRESAINARRVARYGISV